MCRRARKWIFRCLSRHKTCRESTDSSPSTLPTRVIDVGPSDGSQSPRIYVAAQDVESETSSQVAESDHTEPYLILSYCWGETPMAALSTRKNLTERMRHLSTNVLPKTIQDAIFVTRKLRVRYLWVDALCILQPIDGDTSDWQIEAGKMSYYYQNALCTLAATGASKSTEGLFLTRPALKYALTRCEFVDPADNYEKSAALMINPSVPRLWRSVFQSPLYSRAWTLQERALSPRILHFTKDAVFWECNELKASEFKPGGLPKEDIYEAFHNQPKERPADLLGLPRNYPISLKEDVWFELIERYSSLEMTVLSDRLPAIAGMAKALDHHTCDEYVAGMWKSFLPAGLAWISRPTGKDSKRKYPTSYTAPSWSWASMGSVVEFQKSKDPLSFKWSAKVESVTVQHGSVDPYVHITNGTLRISGLLKRVAVPPDLKRDAYDPFCWSTPSNAIPWKLHEKTRNMTEALRDLLSHYASQSAAKEIPVQSITVMYDRAPEPPIEQALCFLLGTHRHETFTESHIALILHRTGLAPAQYRRAGIARFEGSDWLSDAQECGITII